MGKREQTHSFVNSNPKNLLDYSPSILRAIRKLFGVNQVELGKRLGIRQGTMSKIENGKLGLTAVQWVSICNRYNIDPSSIFSGRLDNLGEDFSVKNEKIGTFKVHKKFIINSKSNVRFYMPLLSHLKEDVGGKESELFLNNLKIDSDYFVILSLPLNLELFNEFFKYFTEKLNLSGPKLNELFKNLIFKSWIDLLKSEMSESESETSCLRKMITKLPSLIGNSFDFSISETNSNLITINRKSTSDRFSWSDELISFSGEYFLSFLNKFCEELNLKLEFSLTLSQGGYIFNPRSTN